jgi:hypothetical protein
MINPSSLNIVIKRLDQPDKDQAAESWLSCGALYQADWAAATGFIEFADEPMLR